LKPRFFCANCGIEVGTGVKVCPSCGKSFIAVRCPRCSYEGREGEFASGCPSCGYMGAAPPRTPVRPRQERHARGRLPPGFYRAAGIALLTLIVVLVFLLLVRS
jgi:predicted RNA-binding Zn-ribbon protein involved in translation (DUF1610 family)